MATVLLFALVGLCAGSFGALLIVRLPKEESIQGCSHCTHCHHKLNAWELIPVLSFLMLGGKCSQCQARISSLYPILELLSMLLFLGAYVLFPADLLIALLLSVVLWLCLLIALIDTRTQMIPDVLTIALGIASIVLHLAMGELSLLAPLIGFLFFGSQWMLSRGKWIGGGDVFLAVALGFLVGDAARMIVALFLSYIVGACVVSIPMIQGKRAAREAVAFGPFLIVGSLLAFFIGDTLIRWVMVMPS